MLVLDLTPDEEQILRAVLTNYLSDLRMEIVDTDSHDFKELLKERKAVIMKVLDTLPATTEEYRTSS